MFSSSEASRLQVSLSLYVVGENDRSDTIIIHVSYLDNLKE